jgi:hypothetical protein
MAREVWRPATLFPVPLEGAECVLQLPRDLTVAEAQKIARVVVALAEMNEHREQNAKTDA